MLRPLWLLPVILIAACVTTSARVEPPAQYVVVIYACATTDALAFGPTAIEEWGANWHLVIKRKQCVDT